MEAQEFPEKQKEIAARKEKYGSKEKEGRRRSRKKGSGWGSTRERQ